MEIFLRETLIGTDIWLQRWTNYNTIHANERIGYWVGIYGAISAAAILGYLASDWYVAVEVVNND